MRYFLPIIILGLSVISCAEPRHDKATALCGCYKALGRIDPEKDAELMNVVADSCKTIHIDILTELENSPEEKEKFNEAYEFCQNEK